MTDAPQREYLDDVPVDLQDLIYDGRMIQAIKLVREKKGWGLKEAKENVDAVAARMREQFPDALAAPSAADGASKGAGCGTAVLLLAVLACLGGYLVVSLI